MDEIISAAQALANALRSSKLYADYRRGRLRLAEHPELSSRILDFKKKQTAFEMKRMQNQSVTFEEEKYISHLYSELMQNEYAKNFLDAEDAFLTDYGRAMEIIASACEIDVIST